MRIDELARIRWACRRGMLELDMIIVPFFNNEYEKLQPVEKKSFIQLLEHDDPDLFQWMMGHSQPGNTELVKIVNLIKERHYQRGPMAV